MGAVFVDHNLTGLVISFGTMVTKVEETPLPTSCSQGISPPAIKALKCNQRIKC